MNYYEKIKDNYYNKEYSTLNLFNDNLQFIFNKMGLKVIVLAILLAFLPIIPFLIKGDFSSLVNVEIVNYFDTSKINQFADVKVNTSYFTVVMIITYILQHVFTMDYFVQAKNQELPTNEYTRRFFKGIRKSLLLMIMLIGIYFLLTMMLMLLILTLKTFGIMIYFAISLVISFIVNIIETSIFDDTRVSFKDAKNRARTALGKRGFFSKYLFGFLASFLLTFTINNILLIMPDSLKLGAVLIARVLNFLISLLISGYLTTVFIYYSDNVKDYIEKPNYVEIAYEENIGEYDE